MKKILFLTIIIASWLFPTFVMAQLKITTDDLTKAICPGQYTYSLGGITGTDCKYSMTAVDQNGTQIGNASTTNSLTVTWSDNPGKVEIRVVNTGGTSCTKSDDFPIVIRSVKGKVPQITTCKDLVIGMVVEITTSCISM